MKIEEYNLDNLISDIKGLEKLQRKDYISGVCNSLVMNYSTKYNLGKKQAISLVYDLTEIYCENYLNTYTKNIS